MTILQTRHKPATDTPENGKRWNRFGHVDEAVRHTDVREHETFVEEQAQPALKPTGGALRC